MPERAFRLLRLAIMSALLVGAASACDAMGGGAEGTAEVGDSATGGLTREQMENQAQGMSQEQAQQLGVVDSTTDLDQPAPVGETMVIPGAPVDTAAAPR